MKLPSAEMEMAEEIWSSFSLRGGQEFTLGHGKVEMNVGHAVGISCG